MKAGIRSTILDALYDKKGVKEDDAWRYRHLSGNIEVAEVLEADIDVLNDAIKTIEELN